MFVVLIVEKGVPPQELRDVVLVAASGMAEHCDPNMDLNDRESLLKVVRNNQPLVSWELVLGKSLV